MHFAHSHPRCCVLLDSQDFIVNGKLFQIEYPRQRKFIRLIICSVNFLVSNISNILHGNSNEIQND